LQKQHSALLLELSHLRTTLDTAQQAVKISTSAIDAELESLIHKWRTASREAAEELFRGARDRVNKMGGVGAWRERSRQQQGGWGDDNDEGEKNEDGSELTPAQREAREAMMEEMKAEREKYGEKKEEVVEEKDDESFTMDMMLRQLNVEPDMIGYDKASQRWA
jgi:Swi5-dependent recombination DNA repair protein 1